MISNDLKNKLLKPRPKKEELVISQYDEGISIDHPSGKIIDDLFWLEMDDKGIYFLNIYVPDVSFYVSKNSKINYHAESQLKTIYSHTKTDVTNFMLPLNLNVNLSLTEGFIRKSLRFKFEIKKKFKLYSISKCYVKNIKAYKFQEADEILNNLNFSNPTDCTLYQIRNIIFELLHGTTNNNNFKYYYSSNMLKDIMDLCNKSISDFFKREKLDGIFHNTYYFNRNYNVKYEVVRNNVYDSRIQITSPLRRYSDLVNQRILKSYVFNNKRNYYSIEYLKSLCINLNIIQDYQILEVEDVTKKEDITLETCITKMSKKYIFKIKELQYLIFECESLPVDLYEYLINTLQYYNGGLNKLLQYNFQPKNVRWQVSDLNLEGLIVSNTIVTIKNKEYTHRYYGLGEDQQKSIANSCFNFIMDYLEDKLVSTKEICLNPEFKFKVDLIDENIYKYIFKFKNTTTPFNVISNLQYKFYPVFKNFKVTKEEFNDGFLTLYTFKISIEYHGIYYTQTISGFDLKTVKDECAILLLNTILNETGISK